MSDQAWADRSFVASQTEVTVIDVSCSVGLDAAMDVLQDAGMLNDQRLALLVAAEQKGADPERLARKLVSLANAVASEVSA